MPRCTLHCLNMQIKYQNNHETLSPGRIPRLVICGYVNIDSHAVVFFKGKSMYGFINKSSMSLINPFFIFPSPWESLELVGWWWLWASCSHRRLEFNSQHPVDHLALEKQLVCSFLENTTSPAPSFLQLSIRVLCKTEASWAFPFRLWCVYWCYLCSAHVCSSL